MNKQSPEYIRVREEITKMLFKEEREAYPSAELPIEFINLSKEMQADYYRETDSILTIKGIAILSDKQQLPEHYDGIYTGYEEAVQRDMLKYNFKKVVE